MESMQSQPSPDRTESEETSDAARTVPDMRLGSPIHVYDTTLRDGSQGEGVSFTVHDKIKVARLLDDLGIDTIEGGWPGSNPKDIEFFERARDLPWKHARLAAFGSTRRARMTPEEDPILSELVRSETPVITIFGKSWTFHVHDVLRTTLDANLEMIRSSVAYLRGFGREVIYDAEHFFDGFKTDPEYALSTLEAASEGGASWVVLCDTNGGSLPWEVAEVVAAVCRRVKTPVGIHTHNDSDLGTANAVAAVKAGAAQVQGTMNGWGERVGNANLCSIIPVLQLKMGMRCLTDAQLARLAETAHTISELANITPNEHLPFIGRSAFAHKAGMHVDAVYKNPTTFEHIDPSLVGNSRRFLISELAGSSSIAGKAKEFGIDLSRSSPETRAILDQVTARENDGYAYEGAEGSFELLIHQALGKRRPLFDLHYYRVVVDRNSDDREKILATVKVEVDGRTFLEVAEGDGPVNALDAALRQALREAYPTVDSIQLVDYRVRVLSASEGTAAKVRVLIECSVHDDAWNTVGVSTNIVEASWHALVDALEYGVRHSRLARPSTVEVETAAAASP